MLMVKLQEIVDNVYSVENEQIGPEVRAAMISALIQEDAIRTAGKWISESLDYVAREIHGIPS